MIARDTLDEALAYCGTQFEHPLACAVLGIMLI